jgi:hypothetical protein
MNDLSNNAGSYVGYISFNEYYKRQNYINHYYGDEIIINPILHLLDDLILLTWSVALVLKRNVVPALRNMLCLVPIHIAKWLLLIDLCTIQHYSSSYR